MHLPLPDSAVFSAGVPPPPVSAAAPFPSSFRAVFEDGTPFFASPSSICAVFEDGTPPSCVLPGSARFRRLFTDCWRLFDDFGNYV